MRVDRRMKGGTATNEQHFERIGDRPLKIQRERPDHIMAKHSLCAGMENRKDYTQFPTSNIKNLAAGPVVTPGTRDLATMAISSV
jgi:hypothetical protein